VKACHEQGIPVCPISGPSSVATFLSASGEECSTFYFLGFFPRKGALDFSTLPADTPIVFFESPKRIEATVRALSSAEHVTTIVLAKELTKTYETIIRGSRETIEEQMSALSSLKGEWIGLFTCQAQQSINPEKVVSYFKDEGFSPKEIGKIGRFLGLSKNDLYKRSLND